MLILAALVGGVIFMKKIDKSDKLIISIILRVLLSTVFSVLIFSIILSLIVSKFDLPLELTDYLTVIITSLSAVTISFISTIGIKNNGLMIGLISQIPLIIYSFANTIIFDNSVLIFIIKLFIVLIIGAITGYLRVNKNRRFKVK